MLGELGGLPTQGFRGQPELGFILCAIFLTPCLRFGALIYARTLVVTPPESRRFPPLGLT